MNRRTLYVISIGLVCTVSFADAPMTLEQAQKITTQALGAQASLFDGQFVRGDFDGNGKSDVGIMADVDAARNDLHSRPIQTIDLNGIKADPKKWGAHCLGLLIVRDYESRGVDQSFSKMPTLSYACYSGVKVVGPNELMRSKSKKRTPTVVGDGLVLEMETGASLVVYWDGNTFRSFTWKAGD